MYNYFLKHTICLALLAVICQGVRAQDNLGLTTVVIDAGHGGNDPGAVSKDKKSYEKTFTLDIAKRLSDKIKAAYPGVKVVMTRSTDVFVPLNDRADKANKADANLFMSIHINSATNTSANGYSVHVLGQSSIKNRDLFAGNLDMVKRENSVILLEDDYSTRYQGFDPNDPESYIFMSLLQNANLEQSLKFAQAVSDKLTGGPIKRNRGISQDPFLVLWRTSMPAVLVELGFISNDADLKELRSADARDRIADRLAKAFAQYKKEYDSSVAITRDEPETPAATPAPAKTAETAPPKPAEPAPAKTAEATAPVAAKPVEAAPAKTAEAAPPKPAATEPRPQILYATQISAVPRLLTASDKLFLGYTAGYTRKDNLYKYVIGISSSESEARAYFNKIRAVHKDCFFVKIESENLTYLK